MLRLPVEAHASHAAAAWVEVDLGAIAHNVRVFRSMLPSACRLIAVVKADGYGHGMLRVARAALAAGADELAVANVAEGAVLRIAGVRAPILLAGPLAPADAGLVVQHGLVASLGGYEAAAALSRATHRFLPVQIEVDTGMRRHGVALRDLAAFVDAVLARGRLSIAGVYTHFAANGPADLPAMRAQLDAFCAVVDALPALRGVRRHACNTLAASLLPEARLDAVRIGGGLYGFDPLRGGASGGLGVRPALALKARVVGLRAAAVGERVGYGGAFVCARPTQLALLPIGYGDGLARELWHGAEVLVRGRRARLVGAISMNQAVVDVTDLPPVVFGEEVVLLGEQGTDRVDAEARVPPGGSVYEVTALLSPRLPRQFVGGCGDNAPHPRGAVEHGRMRAEPTDPRR